MGNLVGIMLIVIAAASIIGVMYIVLQEKHEHEEHYIPPAPGEKSTESDSHRAE
ncbi:MAG: hypothetical protein IAE80_07465 [Anaerolinea sp.]|nr:hypothetical protein [Anaerolinea sp.]